MMLLALVFLSLSATETQRLSIDDRPSQHSPLGSEDLTTY